MQAVDPGEGPKWKPLERNERRVLGVLVEKAKTTPSAYPLTLNALRTGSNQKSNRFPSMELEEHHIEDAVESLQKQGAVTRLQGDGRTEKFRHHAYEWLGVDKVELAVMAELLLRGAQTLGELRARASRMEPIKTQGDLQPIVNTLVERGLMVYLTPPGRGAVVTHNLYQPQELEKVQREHGGGLPSQPVAQPAPPTPPPTSERPNEAPSAAPEVMQPGFREDPPASAPRTADDSDLRDQIEQLRGELAELREEYKSEVAELRSELEDVLRQLTG